jgi:hypothetical protein
LAEIRRAYARGIVCASRRPEGGGGKTYQHVT